MSIHLGFIGPGPCMFQPELCISTSQNKYLRWIIISTHQHIWLAASTYI